MPEAIFLASKVRHFELRPPNWVFSLHSTRWCYKGGDNFFLAEIIRQTIEKMLEAIFSASKVRHFELGPPNWVFSLHSTRWYYKGGDKFFFSYIIRPPLEKMPEAIFWPQKLAILSYGTVLWRLKTQFGGHSSKWRTFEAEKMASGIFSNGGLMISAKKKIVATLITSSSTMVAKNSVWRLCHSSKWQTFEARKIASGIFSNSGLMIYAKKKLMPTL